MLLLCVPRFLSETARNVCWLGVFVPVDSRGLRPAAAQPLCGPRAKALKISPPSSSVLAATSHLLDSIDAPRGLAPCAIPLVAASANVSRKDLLLIRTAGEKGMVLLNRLGPASTKFTEFHAITGVHSESCRGSLISMLLCGLSPSCVMGYTREMHRFLDWLSTIQISVCNATGLVLVAYIRNVSCRGVSIPVKVRCALV